jgi:predicted ribosomally synthesized peptide with SipW-like signal peptide
MNKKKFALMFASIALIASTVLFGTLAYFTDSESVANTFTVGNINIMLDEEIVDEYGVPTGEGRTQDPTDATEKEGNEYKLVPGRTYVKDPTMTVAKGSEPAYIRMLVTISHIEVFDAIFDAMDNATNQVDKPELMDIFNGYDKDSATDEIETLWKYHAEYRSQTTTPGTITYEFRYYDDSKADNKAIFDARTAAEDIKLPALFDSFTVPGFFGSAQIQDLDGMTITVIGQAIQADTFADENAAWDAFDDQVVVNNNYKSPYANTATP